MCHITSTSHISWISNAFAGTGEGTIVHRTVVMDGHRLTQLSE